MFRSPCSKCGTTEYPKWYRKAHGQWGYASFCILCNREDIRIKNERWFSKKENRDKTNAASRAKRKGNPYYQEKAREYYAKHRAKRLKQKKEKYQAVDPYKDKRRKFSLIGKIYEGVW